MLAPSVKKRHWGRWVVFGPLFLVVAAVALSCYFYEDEVVPADKMAFQKQNIPPARKWIRQLVKR